MEFIGSQRNWLNGSGCYHNLRSKSGHTLLAGTPVFNQECRDGKRLTRTNVNPLDDDDPAARLSIPSTGCRAEIGRARSGESSRK